MYKFSIDNLKNINTGPMKYRCSDIFNSKNIKKSIHQQNSTFGSPYQSRHPKQEQQSDGFYFYTLKVNSSFLKQKIYFRTNLSIQYLPDFSILSEKNQTFTIRLKQYHLELLPWLVKKEPLFKINILLGIYIALLQLVDCYGLFPIHPNMMRVNQKQQVAVWINKNFETFEPDQILTKNAFSMREFMKSFLRIFKCCLPNKKMSDMYQQPKQLLNELVKIKRRQQIHKNCHQFIQHDNKIACSRKQNKCSSTALLQSKTIIHQNQRYSTKIISRFSSSPKKENTRQSSFSPLKNEGKTTSLQKRFSKTNGFKSEKNLSFVPHFFKKRSESIIQNSKQQFSKQQKRQVCISSTGQLFKRYIMYNTTKFQKMSKTSHYYTENSQNGSNGKGFIFRSEVYRLNDQMFKQPIIEQSSPFRPFQTVSQLQNQQISNTALFSPIKFRKMSSNTNQKKKEPQVEKKFGNSGNWRKTYKQQQNFAFAPQQRDDSPKNQGRQKLKNSFPYKTASTLTSFRLSNQHQHSIIPCRSQENLALPVQIPLCVKQKDKQIQEMKIQQQNELQSQFNNIFSMQNSNLKREQDQKRLQKIMSEFQQILF